MRRHLSLLEGSAVVLGDFCALVCRLIGTKTSQPVDVELGQLFGT